jgi:ubiquinone/menaquinone biosynthesis C-methylase UbiE
MNFLTYFEIMIFLLSEDRRVIMENFSLLFVVFTAFFPLAGLVAEEPSEAKQYNAFAKKYSEVFLKNNQDSITAYFRYLDIPLEGKAVLDLGCGDGYDLSQIKLKKAAIFGIDASEEMIKLAQQKNPDGTIKLGFFEKIPFQDHLFDVVISKWAFQTSANIDPIYHEIARVMKQNGQLIYLSSHPIRQFIEKKRKSKDYFKKEIVESVFFDGQVITKEPSHTLNEYLSPTFFEYFTLESYEEGYDSGVEKVDGDVYPSYFIIKARLKNNK